MAVLKHDPSSLRGGIVNQFNCFWSLTLAERDVINSLIEFSLICEFLEERCWISTLTEYKDHWDVGGQVSVHDLHVGCGWLYKVLA